MLLEKVAQGGIVGRRYFRGGGAGRLPGRLLLQGGAALPEGVPARASQLTGWSGGAGGTAGMACGGTTGGGI
jgi:hypothetical protein